MKRLTRPSVFERVTASQPVVQAAKAAPAVDSSSKTQGTRMGRRLVVGIVVAALVIAGAVALAVTSAPKVSTPATTASSTSISAGADSIIASAVRTNPAGYTLESSEPASSRSNLQLSDWALLQQADGSEANISVIVYSSTNASQTHFERFVAGVESLPGYTDITNDLGSFQQYGKCYGYGEDVDSIALVNGICTKGNVFLYVHLVSSISFSDLEGDMTSIMGALYQSAT